LKIALMGGTFDPVHIGHLIGAETAANELGLDQVLFVPAANPPHKLEVPITSAVHRVAMLREALAGNGRFGICLEELERGGNSYTIDTLRSFKKRLKAGDELFFILGADNLNDLHTWKNWEDIYREARIVALAREGSNLGQQAIEKKPGGKDIIFVRMPLISISATGIRQACEAGKSIRYMVPEPVAGYIEAHGLYRKSRS